MLYENDDRVKENTQNKNNALANANSIYSQLRQGNQDITRQNEQYLDEYYNKNVDLANRKTDFDIEKINQQQQQSEKNYQNQARQLNADYQNSINKYGVEAEIRAQSGLNSSGYASYMNNDKFVKFQTQLSTARSANEQAIQEFENQKSQARLENDASIAQYGLDVLKQRLEAQLREFQYNSDLTLDQLTNSQTLEQDYYSRYLDIVNQLNYEKEQAEAKRQYEEQLKYQKEQDKKSNALAEKYYQLSKKYG